MKCNASDQCLRLLHALENNYDCILDSCLLSLSTKEKFNTDKEGMSNHRHSNNNNSPRHRHLIPNATSYNLTLHTLANSDGGPNVSYEACNILLRMINRCKRYIDTIDSLFLDNNDDRNYGDENVNTSRVQRALAKGLLPSPPCEPTIITMNSVIHAIARSNTADAGHCAEEVYRVIDQWSMECKERQQKQQMSFVDSGYNNIPNNNNNNRVWLYQGIIQNARTLACTIDAWANSNNIKTTTTTTTTSTITTTTYQQDSSSLFSCNNNFAPERADAILQLAINQRRAYVNEVITRMKQKQVNVVQEHYNNDKNYCMEMNIIDDGDDDIVDDDDDDDDIKEEIVIDELRQQPKIEDSASTILSSLPSLSIVNDEDTLTLPPLTDIIDRRPLLPPPPPPPLPNTVAFNTCIHAWSNSGRGREGAIRAEELLFQLQSLSESGELNLTPASSGNANHELTSSMDDYAAIDVVAQEVEKEDEDVGLSPNVRTYTMVMTAWANAVTDDSGIEAATRCENILLEMETQGANNLLVRPNLVAYVTAISAWARTRGGGDNNIAASHAEFILNRMIDLYYNHKTLELPADIVNANHDAPFNSVITCYARCADPNSTERAFAILERLIVSPIPPTVTTFNSVLDVCAKHGEPDRALDVLDKMKEMSIRPDSTSYDTVLNAFGRCSYPNSANKASDFLCKLENSPDEYNYKPSMLSYSTVINAFARVSGKESSYGGLEAVKKAKEIYDRLIYQMENGLIHGIVDPFANSCLLNCCANVYGCESDKQAALVIAINLFEEMKKRPELHGEPNQYTFGTMMKVCARLSLDDDEKHRLMENLFIQACKRGACSKAVIGQFLRNTPTHLNMNVILSLGGTKRDIPHSWFRNVARRQWPTLM